MLLKASRLVAICSSSHSGLLAYKMGLLGTSLPGFLSGFNELVHAKSLQKSTVSFSKIVVQKLSAKLGRRQHFCPQETCRLKQDRLVKNSDCQEYHRAVVSRGTAEKARA